MSEPPKEPKPVLSERREAPRVEGPDEQPQPAEPDDEQAPDAHARTVFSRSRAAIMATRTRRAGPGEDAAAASSAAAPTSRADYASIKGDLHLRLLKEIGERNLLGVDEVEIEKVTEEFVARVLAAEEIPLNEAERARLVDELREEALGVGPISPFLADPSVTDILVNRFDEVWVESFGKLKKTSVRFRNDDHLIRVIERIAARIGRRIDTASPMLDARLEDGSRVNATVPPISIDGPTLSIRKFGGRRLRRIDLVQLGSVSEPMLQFLDAVVAGKKNLLISGGTGAGKSTLLGALCESIPNDERIITIEDPAELMLDQQHVVRFECRPPNAEGRGRVAARELVINSLRMRPDRIIVGEVRGAEALDMLQAMNTGHEGSLSTIHANSPRDAIARLETMVLMAELDLPSRAIREQIVSSIEILVHVRRYEDGARRIEAITEITGLEGVTPLLQDIFRYQRKGKKGAHVLGEFVATGIVPRAVERLRERGIDVPLAIFRPAGGA